MTTPDPLAALRAAGCYCAKPLPAQRKGLPHCRHCGVTARELPPPPAPEPEPKPPYRPRQGSAAALLLEVASRWYGPFRLELLVETAWMLCPDKFGFEGIARKSYPDLHKVMCLLSGKRGLVARGKIRRTGKMLEVVR